jgi:hypothetical protein
MAFVRTFVIKSLPNEISIEQLRDCMEYLGSLCRIDKVPKENNWEAYLYYESWKTSEITNVIDEEIEKNNSDVICYIDPCPLRIGYDHSVAKPIISLYPLTKHKFDVHLLFMCKNTSQQAFDYMSPKKPMCDNVIRFIPKDYSLIIYLSANDQDMQDNKLLSAIQSFCIGDIKQIKKTKIIYDEADSMEWEIEIHFNHWYVNEYTYMLQNDISKYGFANVCGPFGYTFWETHPIHTTSNDDSVNKRESWVRPNRHIYF